MNPVTILLLESDPEQANLLAVYLTQMNYRVMGPVETSDKALELYRDQQIDCTILDLGVSALGDGIELAAQLQAIRTSPFIFLTNDPDEATLERARQVGPTAYVSRPFNDIILHIAIDLALQSGPVKKTVVRPMTRPEPSLEVLEKLGETLVFINDIVFLKHNYRFVKFPLSDILYIQSEGNYTDIITTNKKYTIRMILNKVLSKLESPDIIRSHRSYAVNVRQVQALTERQLQIGPFTIPVGRSFRVSFMEQFSRMEPAS